jgi:hypothetical protein
MHTTIVGAQIDLIDAAVRACYERPGPLAPGVCAGVFVDGLHARSVGARSNGEATSVYGGAVVGGSLRAGLTDWLSIRLLAEAGAPLAHQPFVILGLGEVFRAPPVTGRSSVGMEASF